MKYKSKFYISEIHIGEYNSEHKDRKIRIRRYITKQIQIETINRRNTIRGTEIDTRINGHTYKSETTNRKNTIQEMKVEKIRSAMYKSEELSEKYKSVQFTTLLHS